MRRRGTIVLRLAALLLLAPASTPAAPAAGAPARPAAGASDARAILARVTRTYRGLTSFQFDATVNVEMLRAGQRSSFDFHYVAAAAKPNRFRVQMDNPMMGATMVSAEGACAAYYTYGRHLEAARMRGAPGSGATGAARPAEPQLVPIGGGR